MIQLAQTYRWCVTGAAGFVGANIVKALLQQQQQVVGIDNFSTGKRANLQHIQAQVTPRAWQQFRFYEADIADLAVLQEALNGVDFVLHQAAFISVPQSLEDPLQVNHDNVEGFVRLLLTGRDARVKRIVYASSSAVYGDCETLPAVESQVGKPLSPYALSKYIDECYADIFSRCYGLESIGLRYFNVFGPMQAPDSAYAAVIPAWINALLQGKPVTINGDGKNTRDFCFVDNIVHANLLAATCQQPEALNRVYNIALGAQTSLLDLAQMLRSLIAEHQDNVAHLEPIHAPPRQGDILFSQADISLAQKYLGFQPLQCVSAGLKKTIAWYRENQAIACNKTA